MTSDAILVAENIGVRFETPEGPVIAVDDITLQATEARLTDGVVLVQSLAESITRSVTRAQ